MKTLSRQSLKLDRKQFAVLERKTNSTVCLVIKPNENTRRNQISDTVHLLDPKTDKFDSKSEIRKREFTIGRIKENNLVCDDPLISSVHCKIICHSQKNSHDKLTLWYTLVDKSTNGTIVDGKVLEKGEEIALNKDSTIRLPSSEKNSNVNVFKFRLPRVLKEDEKLINDLFIDNGKKRKEFIEEKEKDDQNESQWNSLNLSIINQSQRASRKRQLSSYSMKSFHSTATGIRGKISTPKKKQQFIDIKELKNLQHSIAKNVGQISGNVYLCNQNLTTVSDSEASNLDELLKSHEEEKHKLLLLLKAMLNDVEGTKIEKWKSVVQKLDK